MKIGNSLRYFVWFSIALPACWIYITEFSDLQIIRKALTREYSDTVKLEADSNVISKYNPFKATAGNTTVPTADTTFGGQLSFSTSLTLLSNIRFPINNFPANINETNDEFVFVTAASDNHFDECLDTIARVQFHFPHHTIFFYDLTIDSSPSRVSKLKRLCHVVYRRFQYHLYPQHVHRLQTYSWKPIIIHEVLLEHGAIFYVDASIRFITSNVIGAIQSRDIVLFKRMGHSIYAATNHYMYKYLPMSKSSAIKASVWGAGAMFLRKSKEIYEHVIRWWLLCALEPSCIAPTYNTACWFDKQFRDRYADCHRYDQSAINILLNNFYESNEERYTSRNRVLVIRRRVENNGVLQVCQPRRQSCRPPVDYFNDSLLENCI